MPPWLLFNQQVKPRTFGLAQRWSEQKHSPPAFISPFCQPRDHSRGWLFVYQKVRHFLAMSTTDDNFAGNGVVTKINPPFITVRAGRQDVRCTLPAVKRSSRADADQRSLIVGDEVEFTLLADGSGQIQHLRPRRNTLSRRSAVPMPSAHAHEQYIAANVDMLVAVFAAANPTPHWGLLDRLLVLAEEQEIPVLVCITKSDLAADDNGSLDSNLAAALEEYYQIGYPFIITCARDGSGIDALRKALDGKLSVFLGKSGVGKTSLLNSLQPGLGRKVKEVNEITGKGRHTTSQSEVFPLDCGGMIIDTPGVREFGLWDLEAADLASFFREMRPYIGQCRFGLGCRHREEPGCAVRKAVMSGQVSPYRYRSYLKLLEEVRP